MKYPEANACKKHFHLYLGSLKECEDAQSVFEKNSHSQQSQWSSADTELSDIDTHSTDSDVRFRRFSEKFLHDFRSRQALSSHWKSQ